MDQGSDSLAALTDVTKITQKDQEVRGAQAGREPIDGPWRQMGRQAGLTACRSRDQSEGGHLGGIVGKQVMKVLP